MSDRQPATPENLPPGFNDWEMNLVADAQKDAAGRWVLIDRLAEGKSLFEPALFWAAAKAAGLSRGTVNNRLSIHKRFPVSRRRENLLPAIHDEFRKLDDALTLAALDRAEEHRWTREQCRMRVKAFKGGDAQALEPTWTPPPVRAKQQNAADAETPPVASEDGDGKAVFESTAAGAAMSAEERREVRDAYAEQNFANGNDFFEKIAATIERKGDPSRFSRECDLKRLNPKRARALAEFFIEVAAAAEMAQTGALGGVAAGNDGDRFAAYLPEARAAIVREENASVSFLQRRMQINFNTAARLMEMLEEEGVVSAPDLSGKRAVLKPATEDFTAPEGGPGGRERLGRANTSEDDVAAGGGEPRIASVQSSPLAEKFDGVDDFVDGVTQTGNSTAPAPGADGGDGLEIPSFLRRGHEDCAADAGQQREGASGDA